MNNSRNRIGLYIIWKMTAVVLCIARVIMKISDKITPRWI